jgi:hypothetical protein
MKKLIAIPVVFCIIHGVVAATCTPPSISMQPVNQIITVGSTATFKVTASGTPPLYYLWFENGKLAGGGFSSYTTPVAKVSERGLIEYYCIVSDSCGSIQSHTAILTVSCAPLVILTEPQSLKTKAPSPKFDTSVEVTFSLQAQGTEPLRYFWQESMDSGGLWFSAGYLMDCCPDGMTTPAFHTSAIHTTYNGYLFRCIVGDPCGNFDTSQAAKLTVTTDTCIWFTTKQKDQYVPVGAPATFTAVATGVSPRSLQWYKDDPNTGAYDVPISGATQSTYTTPPATIADNQTSYYCLATGPCGFPVQGWGGVIYIIPSVPSAPSPADNATNQKVHVTLSWSAPNSSLCTLQVSTVKDFSYKTVTYLVSGASQAFSLTGNTTYYWHVNASNNNGSSGYSATWSFTTAPAPPAVPVLSEPANGATNMGAALLLRWGTVDGASSYHVQVATDTAFLSIFFEDSTLIADSMGLDGLANGTTYYWRIRAKNNVGTSSWSYRMNFTVNALSTRRFASRPPREFEAFFSSRPSAIDVMVTIPDEYQHATEVRIYAISGSLVGSWELVGSGVRRISIDARKVAPGMYLCAITNGQNCLIKKMPLPGIGGQALNFSK